MNLLLLTLSCAPQVNEPSLPEQPDFQELWEQLNEPSGILTADVSERLKEWLLDEGGVAFLGSSILLQNLIPNIIEQLSGSFTDGTNLAELPLEGDGWIRATLPCHTTKDIDEAFLQVHSLYTENGLSPNMWGEARQCTWEQWGIELNAELSMVLDLPLSFLDNSDVDDTVLLGWDGQGSVGEWGFDMRYTAKLQEERVYTLWSDTSGSFVIDIPNLDVELLTDLQSMDSIESALDELQILSLGVDTVEGRWECVLVEARCVGRDGLIVDEVLTW